MKQFGTMPGTVCLGSIIFLLCSVLPAQVQSVSVTGTLSRAVAIGGESTGWSMQLDSAISIDGKQLRQIEVESEDGRQLQQFAGKRVHVSGRLEQRQGVERGPRSILTVSSIEEADGGDAINRNEPSLQSAGELAGSAWTLTDLAGGNLIGDRVPTLTFPEAGRAAGNASCNRFFGTVSIKGSDLKLGPLATTRMACTEAVMEQETTYLKILQAAAHFEIANSTLTLHCKGFAKPLLFTRSKPATRN